MRTGLLWAGAAAIALAGALPAAAAGIGAAEICTGAGYRAGTVSFDMCLSRVGVDDPLAALENADDIDRVPISGERDDDDPLEVLEQGKGVAVQVVRVPARNGDLRSFGNSARFGSGNGAGGGSGGGGSPPGTPGGGAPPGVPPAGPGGGFVTPPTQPTAPTAPQITPPFGGGSFSAFNFGN